MSRMSKTHRELLEFIGARSPALALHVNEPLVEFLIVARKLCGDDSDAVLVLMIIIQRANRHPAFPLLQPAKIHQELPSQLPSLAMNVRSIADSSGIPRETVRRKVQVLIKQGLVELDDRAVRFSPEGYLKIEPARAALVKLAGRAYAAIADELAKAGELESKARRSHG